MCNVRWPMCRRQKKKWKSRSKSLERYAWRRPMCRRQKEKYAKKPHRIIETRKRLWMELAFVWDWVNNVLRQKYYERKWPLRWEGEDLIPEHRRLRKQTHLSLAKVQIIFGSSLKYSYITALELAELSRHLKRSKSVVKCDAGSNTTHGQKDLLKGTSYESRRPWMYLREWIVKLQRIG